jgi:hypothetical protein
MATRRSRRRTRGSSATRVRPGWRWRSWPVSVRCGPGVGVVAYQSWWAGFGIAACGVAVASMVVYFNPWFVAGVAISAAIAFAGVQALQAA